MGSLPYDPKYGYDLSAICDIVSFVILVALFVGLVCWAVYLLDPKGRVWGPPLDWINRKVDQINSFLDAWPFMFIDDDGEED